MRDIKRIILHCTATKEGAHVDVDTIRKWHLARNFSDIGYHYVVESLSVTFGELELHGHNEYSNKACPSFDVQAKYKFLNR